MGELVVEENIRAVIREQADSGGRGVPWIDAQLCCEMTTARDIADFDRLSAENRRVFFDRGLMDMYGTNGVAPSPRLIEALRTRRYNLRVFVFPPWEAIYATDAERREPWSHMDAVHRQILRILPELNYTPIIVPVGSVEARAAFVLAQAQVSPD
jgi:predicted ATPase